MLESEKVYIKKAKSGNQEAFGALYDHYLPGIYRFILLKVSNRAEAEDLAHEVFLSAWKNIPNYRDKGFPFSSWLYQIARNAVIDFYRTSKKIIQIEEAPEEFIRINFAGVETLNLDFEMNVLKKCLSLLKPEYQDVVIMRFIEEMPHGEVASALGKSEGAIRLAQHRAIKELKILYENEVKKYPGSETSVLA